LADWKFDLWITHSASRDYRQLQAVAEAAVSSECPLPLNSDARLSTKVAAVNHYERTRKLLRSIVKPQEVGLDMGLLGIYHYVRYRTELGTCIYFSRITEPPAVLVYGFSESPLDYQALRNIIVSGNADVLAKLGLPLPRTNTSLMIN
jgi:hypothetical protein